MNIIFKMITLTFLTFSSVMASEILKNSTSESEFSYGACVGRVCNKFRYYNTLKDGRLNVYLNQKLAYVFDAKQSKCFSNLDRKIVSTNVCTQEISRIDSFFKEKNLLTKEGLYESPSFE